MADLTPIMTLFREWEAKFASAGDLTKTTDEQSDKLLDQCRTIERLMMGIPIADVADMAAKLIVATSYGGFALPDRGEGGLIDEAEAILAVREHPDAKLIELGRQFEQVKAECRPLEGEWKRLQRAFEKAREDAGLNKFDVFTPEISKVWRKLSQQVGYEPARRSFTAKHDKTVRLMKAIHRTKATTLEGFAVKAAAVAFDQSDFEVSNPIPADVAERELYRLARDMAKVVKANARRAAL